MMIINAWRAGASISETSLLGFSHSVVSQVFRECQLKGKGKRKKPQSIKTVLVEKDWWMRQVKGK